MTETIIAHGLAFVFQAVAWLAAATFGVVAAAKPPSKQTSFTFGVSVILWLTAWLAGVVS